MRNLLICFRLAVLATAVSGWAVTAAAQSMVPVEPPPPRVEVVPAPPGAAYVWRPGHWAWRHGAYVWIPGHYARAPRHGAVWVAGHWRPSGAGWVWVPGHWR